MVGCDLLLFMCMNAYNCMHLCVFMCMCISIHIDVRPKIPKSIALCNVLKTIENKEMQIMLNLEAAHIWEPILGKIETITNFSLAYGVLVRIASVLITWYSAYVVKSIYIWFGSGYHFKHTGGNHDHILTNLWRVKLDVNLWKQWFVAQTTTSHC